MDADYPGDYEAAVAFLDRRIGYGIRPGLERIERLLGLMGDPHRSYPVIHVAGTNGKTTVVRMISDILGAHGLFTGSFISPHLHRVEDRYALGGTGFGKTHLARAVEDVAPFVMMQEEQFEEQPTYFELTAAVGFEAFRVDAVDVAVIEVGLGGRRDATNLVEADVSVITGVAIDHTSYLGDTQSKIAAEKAAILKDDGTLVTGPLGSEATSAVASRVAETNSVWHKAPEAFRVNAVDRDERGWVTSIQGIHAEYTDLVLGIHGRHQVTHLATAIAACEAFFGRALDEDAVREAAATVRSPGRLEVAGLEPTVLIDGAHNEEGFRGLARALAEEFDEEHWTLVVGLRGKRDAAELLSPLRGRISRVVTTKADDRLAVDPGELAVAAEKALDVPSEAVESVPQALEVARDGLATGEGLLVAGSLYVVGEARHAMGLDNAPSPVHRRFEAELPIE
ncbi:MAG: Mur ligase family protein [Acidimicrobiia bacterium]|nr:Mur ligase family protein [Acidimicrobiia bacterium]